MLKIELKRGFKRNTFLITLAIGIIICLGDLLINSQFYIRRILDPSFGTQAFSLEFMKGFVRSPYESFALFSPSEMSNLFFILIPILSAISFSDSYLEDLNSGFLKNVLSRCSKRNYLHSKFFANFIVSGITIALPLLIQLIFLLATRPNIMPYKLSGTISMGWLNLDLFFNNPLAYTLIWIFISFMFAGVISSIALGISIVLRNKFVAVIAPFIVVMGIHILFDLLGLYRYSVIDFLRGGFSIIGMKFYHMVITFALMFLLTYIPFYFGGKSNEVF